MPIMSQEKVLFYESGGTISLINNIWQLQPTNLSTNGVKLCLYISAVIVATEV